LIVVSQGLRSAQACALFRSLRDRAIGGVILLRDGKHAWRLRRC
jgi:hypothetical protein